MLYSWRWSGSSYMVIPFRCARVNIWWDINRPTKRNIINWKIVKRTGMFPALGVCVCIALKIYVSTHHTSFHSSGGFIWLFFYFIVVKSITNGDMSSSRAPALLVATQSSEQPTLIIAAATTTTTQSLYTDGEDGRSTSLLSCLDIITLE